MENESQIKEMNELKVFIGKWHHEGKSYADGQDKDNPLASVESWKSDESYEWLAGNFFIVHKWNAMVGKNPFIGTEIIGYDKKKNQYFSHHFDNSGFHPNYNATVKDNIWKFNEPNTRVEITINNSNSMTLKWEWRKDNIDWLPLCDRTASRII